MREGARTEAGACGHAARLRPPGRLQLLRRERALPRADRGGRGPAAGPRQDRLDLHGVRRALCPLGLRAAHKVLGRGGEDGGDRKDLGRDRVHGRGARSSCAPRCRPPTRIYASSVGGPREPHDGLRQGRLRDARADGALRRPAQGGAGAGRARRRPAQQQRAALIDSANDGSVLGYLEAFGVAVWDTASGYASSAAPDLERDGPVAAMATGFGSAMLKCLLIALTILPLYLLLLAAAAIVWFMEQLRYFLAVTGTMMLPLFTGMFSLPEGHHNRQAAQGYVMHMVSLALWPVSWAIGHTGTIALYNALVSLIAGTSRVPDMAEVLQWSSITAAAPTGAQVGAMETALGNWFMGNLTALLSVLVGGLGFVLWVAVVSILGPVFLHKLLATGALFMAQAAGSVGRQAAGAGRLAVSFAQATGIAGGPGMLAPGPGTGERLTGAIAAEAFPVAGGIASMADAARRVEDSDGKPPSAMG